ncbi:hypothetical protein CGL56_16360 [Neolewinella marina]|uniref:Uncharacterized protein n=1 Tax=Neolewinella marina TaxID=438751 RepID=A0A2G0CBR8_9BACT|nr:hypothetical protein CGL56_16360 [Neolewinella marina]
MGQGVNGPQCLPPLQVLALPLTPCIFSGPSKGAKELMGQGVNGPQCLPLLQVLALPLTPSIFSGPSEEAKE